MSGRNLELTLKNKELTSYLQAMVEDGCELNRSILDTINNYHEGQINNNTLFLELQAEWKFQTIGNQAEKEIK